MEAAADTVGGGGVAGLCLGWVAVWCAGHYVFWFAWHLGRRPLFASADVEAYRRRLFRSQVYCTAAVVGGIYLLAMCDWNPRDLLYRCTPAHQVLFSMAVAHWVVCIFEDLRCMRFLSAGMNTKVLSEVNAETALSAASAGSDASASGAKWQPDTFAETLLLAYLLHHVVAGGCFACVLAFRACTGLGACGLIFELPVLLMNHREFAVCQDPRPVWFFDERQLKRFWGALASLFVLARLGPSILYFYAVGTWWGYGETLPLAAWVMFHLSAVFFTILNLCLVAYLLAWRWSDIVEARAWHRGTSAGNAKPVDEESPNPSASDREHVAADAASLPASTDG